MTDKKTTGVNGDGQSSPERRGRCIEILSSLPSGRLEELLRHLDAEMPRLEFHNQLFLHDTKSCRIYAFDVEKGKYVRKETFHEPFKIPEAFGKGLILYNFWSHRTGIFTYSSVEDKYLPLTVFYDLDKVAVINLPAQGIACFLACTKESFPMENGVVTRKSGKLVLGDAHSLKEIADVGEVKYIETLDKYFCVSEKDSEAVKFFSHEGKFVTQVECKDFFPIHDQMFGTTWKDWKRKLSIYDFSDGKPEVLEILCVEEKPSRVIPLLNGGKLTGIVVNCGSMAIAFNYTTFQGKPIFCLTSPAFGKNVTPMGDNMVSTGFPHSKMMRWHYNKFKVAFEVEGTGVYFNSRTFGGISESLLTVYDISAEGGSGATRELQSIDTTGCGTEVFPPRESERKWWKSQLSPGMPVPSELVGVILDFI